MTLEYWGCMAMLITAFITDVRSMKIPNKITLSGFIIGLAYHAVTGGIEGILFAMKGAAAGFGLMFIMYLFRAVGGGDVKLFGAIGAWLGVSLTLSILMYSILAAGVLGMVILLLRRELIMRIRNVMHSLFGILILHSLGPVQAGAKKQLQMPFMLAVLPGAVYAILTFS
ncbi:prepilin peptidase [Paenibacillus motobuensis]|uniref:Prepilin peptidase n=1 Tax=Paenibacillus lutimineralis TaxID=2707005 RepID=A0A3S9V2X3_9BACL|nr:MULTISPECIES: prepilin peptidase [Paenibacillus]AZS16853.1 prepilin peptidase [Paenibacillus lutimineralis]MCM3039045.1 prepilin peptidase [Paenibacillus lutimineralis]MCM3646149.1 prepilin peptidase [Paenibacillus motobuensis]